MRRKRFNNAVFIKAGKCLLPVLLLFAGCKQEVKKETKLFETLPQDSTGINFINKLSYDDQFNVFTYRNFYNGGGVAVGDINNDGLPDIFFTGNMVPNRLYLNKGNFKISQKKRAY
jgi:enediyne biosynthesis protein E4